MFANVAKIAYLRAENELMWPDVVATIVMATKGKPGEPGAEKNPKGMGDYMNVYAVYSRAIRVGGVDLQAPKWSLLWVCESEYEAINDCRTRLRDNDDDIVEYKYEAIPYYRDNQVLIV